MRTGPRRVKAAGRPRRFSACFDQADLLPGRPLGTVLNEGDGEHGRRNDNGIGAVKRGSGKMGRRWSDRAKAEGRTCTAGRVSQLAGVMIGRLLGSGGRLDGMVSVMAGMRSGHHVVVDASMALHVLAGLLVNRRASHAEAAGDRLKRKQGHEQPNEQFLENAVHCGGEYSMTILCSGHHRHADGRPACLRSRSTTCAAFTSDICLDLTMMGRCTVSI